MQEQPWEAPVKVTFAYIEEPPFASEVDSLATGSDIELAQHVLRTMGVRTVETRKVEFADMLPGVAASRWTMNTALFITPERCREVDFSDPIWALGDGLIVRRGNPRGITSYAAIAAHQEAKLGALRGTVQIVEAYQDGMPRDRVVEFGTQDEALAAIRNGQVDAYSGTALGHRTLLARLKAADLELAPDFQPPVRGGHALAGFGAFSFAKSNQAFVARFNATLASYLGGAEHRAMMARHGFTEAEIDPAIAMRGRLADPMGADHVHVDRDPWMGALEGREARRQQPARGGVDRRDGDMTTAQIDQITEFTAKPIQIPPKVARELAQQLPVLGHHDAAAIAHEERRSKFVLEKLDLPADGAGGDVEAIRGLSDRSAAGDLGEVQQRWTQQGPSFLQRLTDA